MKRPLNIPYQSVQENPFPWAGLVTSLKEEHEYDCIIEGDLPELSGRLLRLGPGLYERGNDRKRMVLDGDGMLQEFLFQGGRVRYRNRFIRTQKYRNEEKAGRFLYPTLSTHSSGSRFENLGIELPHQANITPLASNGRILAFDESQKPYELNAQDLTTLGEMDLDSLQPKLRYWAHWKMDPKNQLFHFLSIKQGPVLKAQVISTDINLKVVARKPFNLPRASYFHDWFITDNYFGFVLHPAIVSLKTLIRVGLGIDTFSDALKWQPEKGNLVFLVDRKTNQTHTFEAQACWMWHSVNAYEDKGEVILDFIGSEEGGGLGDPNSPLFTIMRNQEISIPKNTINHLRRYRMHPSSGKILYQTLDQSGNFELPTVSAYLRGKPYDYGHFIQALPGEFFARGLGEWDQKKESLNSYISSENDYFSEPLAFSSLGKESSYLSSLVYNGDVKKSYLAIFEKGHLTKGPITKIWLQHHSPLGFHGYWQQI